LNITRANRVITVDLWWNEGLEHQAFGRVWRIGQTKPCYMYRVVSRSDIDLKIRELQKLKSLEIDHALQDDNHVPAQLSDKQLMWLLADDLCKKSDDREKTAVPAMTPKKRPGSSNTGVTKGRTGGTAKAGPRAKVAPKAQFKAQAKKKANAKPKPKPKTKAIAASDIDGN
jgi:hypothetical protein